MPLEEQIKAKAFELGFDAVGIADASPIDRADVERFHAWLSAGRAGQMRYMHRHLDKRIHPALLLEDAASVIVVGLGYKSPVCSVPARAYVETQDFASLPGVTANMACYDDYHIVIKSLLYELESQIRSWTPEPLRFKVCVDSVPLAERALAVRAGLGFIGRNHMLIHPTLGPQLFLGELITTLKLTPDERGGMCLGAGCQDCRRCIAACPTGALQADGTFDARRCVSYLTIEHKGEIDPELSRRMGNRVFGCDECTLACPFHASAPACKSPALKHHPERAHLNLQEILSMTPDSFASRFANSPLLRPGLTSLQRNARICERNAIGI
jgi:epoxyqueuosine reductase